MEMIDSSHRRLSIVRQCALVSISRSTFYYQGKGESALNLKLMRLIDERWLKTPFYGSRRMARHLGRQGHSASRKRVRRLMKKMGLEAVYPRPRTSKPHPEQRVYPYLLRNMVIEKSNQVWCADITYIPMRHGFMYLAAVMDWYSRRMLSWRLSNTLETDFCVAALEDALRQYGTPDIFNTDQGTQFTSLEFTGLLKEHGVRISMDGRGRWIDNIFIERLWGSLKYEYVYLSEFEDGKVLRRGIKNWIDFYNAERGHNSLDNQTPDEAYFGLVAKAA
jgi:putative transposase